MLEALAGGCIDCGEVDPIVLHFDHVRGKKLGNVTTMAHAQRPLEVLRAEIAKCEVRCANCHTRRTASTGGWWKTLPMGSFRKEADLVSQ